MSIASSKSKLMQIFGQKLVKSAIKKATSKILEWLDANRGGLLHTFDRLVWKRMRLYIKKYNF